MSDLTLEQRAKEIFGYVQGLAEHENRELAYATIAGEIRLAVAAENERCAKANPANVPCPKKSCAVGIGVPCEDEHNKFWIPCHPERWQAAIRALQSPA